MIYVNPGDNFTAVFNFGTTGLTLGWQIVEPDDTVVAARVTTGVNENPNGSGVYMVTASAPAESGYYSVVIDDGAGAFLTEELAVAGPGLPEVMPPTGGHYTSPTALRLELSVDDDVLSDSQAYKLIESAEDAIDELIGAGVPDATTGRKIVQADVESWQWIKLMRATTKLAAALYQQPDLLKRARWDREKGPDFEVEGPRGSIVAADVMLPLNQSSLRRLSGHARPGYGSSRYDRFFSAR